MTIHNLAFIVPTKDRREDLGKLLTSFEAQSRVPDQLVIVDGGGDTIDDLVACYPDLPIDYVRVYPPGFTKQKNAGAKALQDDITLVGYLDDDIILEPDAIEELMRFWDSAGDDVGGTEFHITNTHFASATFFTRLFGTNDGCGGALLRSGFNVILDPVLENTEVQWLCGGATVWRREIVEGLSHDEWFEGYGHMDDVDYSCMVGERYRMFVLRDARLAHYERPIPLEKEYVFGVYDAANRYYLVSKHPDRFSKGRYFWATVGKIMGRFARAVLRGDRASWDRARGYLVGLSRVLRGRLRVDDAQVK